MHHALIHTLRSFVFSFFLPRSRPVWTSSPEVAAGYNKLRSWVAVSDAMFEQYQSPPTPIDFAAAKKSVRDSALVADLEAFYTANRAPAETHTLPESDVQNSVETVAYLTELDALHQELLPVLETEIDFFTTTRTTKDTTVFDMKLNYPLIHEEIEDELERREWFKDTGIGSSGK